MEDPSVGFQRIRDYVDAINCSTLPSFSRECLLQGFNKAMVIEAREKHKINKVYLCNCIIHPLSFCTLYINPFLLLETST